MKSTSNFASLLLLPIVAGIVIGCATAKIWSSSPPVQTVRNDAFDASFNPLLEEGQKFYDRFQLRIKNKTDIPLIIDWQNCRYLLNGRENERFVFKGVTSENMRNLPPDTVAPGAEFIKTIAPVKLIGFERLRSKTLQPGESGFSAGLIPAGQHGILLIVKQNQKTISEKILLEITVKED